jgi:hypothetical protein
MGLFALPDGDHYRDDIQCAIWNLKIFLEHDKDDSHPEYLLDFAEAGIEKAKKKLEAIENV